MILHSMLYTINTHEGRESVILHSMLYNIRYFHLTCTHTVQVSYWYLTYLYSYRRTQELYNLKRDVRRMSATILLKYILTITHHSIIVQPVNSVSAVNQTSNCNWCGSVTVWCNDARCIRYRASA